MTPQWGKDAVRRAGVAAVEPAAEMQARPYSAPATHCPPQIDSQAAAGSSQHPYSRLTSVTT